MTSQAATTWIAFAKSKRIALGSPREVATAVKEFVDGSPESTVLIFDAFSSRSVELDLRGTQASVLRRLPAEPPVVSVEPDTQSSTVRSPGRPKLGVVAREVTLLPRHWDWLATQTGGASVALRRLVENAVRENRDKDAAREARDAAYRFMHAMAGDEPGFEEASRALFADDTVTLEARIAKWPKDIRKHTLSLAERVVAKAAPANAPEVQAAS